MSRMTHLLFVWNADFNLRGGLKALREVAQGQHECSLCSIAYHRVRQTSEWKSYKRELRERLCVEVREPCRNQLRADDIRAAQGRFPAVLARRQDSVACLLGSEAIEACDGDFAQFRTALDAAIANYDLN